MGTKADVLCPITIVERSLDSPRIHAAIDGIHDQTAIRLKIRNDLNEADIYQALELVKETGLLTSFHAKNERLIQLFGERIQKTGRIDPMAFVESRLPVVEAMSVAQLTALC